MLVSHSDGHPPDGYRIAERYAVVPDLRRARFLVPLATRRAASASLLRYNALRPVRRRAVRGVLGLGFRAGLGAALPRLTVAVPRDAPPSALLSTHLAEALGRGPLVFGVGVRPLDPNSKPTLQLFSPGGTSIGYAKIGWNPATRELVANEAASITALPPLEAAHVPAVLHHGSWNERTVTVTEPLPARVRGHRDPDTPPPLDLLRAIAAPSAPAPLAASAYWKRLRDETAGVKPADADDRRFGEALRAALDRVERTGGGAGREFGRWHGDWVPWNVGTHRGRLQVWDWEHSADQVPFGLDLLHWRFQVALVLRGAPLSAAVAAVRESARYELGDPAAADLYLLEMSARTWRLRRGGGGWNPALHPALLGVLAEIGGTV